MHRRWRASARALFASPSLASAGLAVATLSLVAAVGAQESDAGVAASDASTNLASTGAVGRRTALEIGRTLTIRTGFVPDPIVFRGEASPEVSLSRFGPDCRGLSTEAPTQRVLLGTRFGFLRIFATSAADLTLAVQTPQGVVCSDDRFGHHPAIEGRFNVGELLIWVGVDAEVAPELRAFELELTETRSIRPGVRRGEDDERLSLAIEAGLDTQPETGTHGDLRLRRGFLPDPRYLSGTITLGERAVDVSGLSEACNGHVPPQPSHVLTLQEDLDFFQIFVAEATEGATLVVLGPDASVGCDAEDETRAQVTREHWPAGLYRIWVGAARDDAAFPYRLGLSEIRRVR